MSNERNRKELVKMLLKNQRLLDNVDENELIDLLLDENISIDVDKEEEKRATLSERVADAFSDGAGSWTFIIIFVLFLIGWIVANIYFIEMDPYPFILLNLFLSCMAALQAPIIMMSQKRQSKKDSLRSLQDYKTDLKSELILEEIHDLVEKVYNKQKILEERINAIEKTEE